MGQTNSDDVHSTSFREAIHPVPSDSTFLVHKVIHDRAKARPDAEAVVSWDRTVSYGELDSISTQLAGYLAAEGIGPEDIVPLLFEKSSWAVVSMLAVLKAGGAFMTLDISQPDSRIRSLIAESGAKIALSSARCHELCSSLVPRAFSVTKQATAELSMPLSHWPAELGNAAYVMATSGSTGTPKLVVTEHSQLSSFVAHLTRPLGFSEGTRAFQFASYAFDPIIGDTFLTLASGGTVCIPSEDERKNDITGAMNRMGVNLAKFTPSLVSSWPDLTITNVPTLKTLILGGEATPATILEEWADKIDLKLIYGSTECTISCVVPDAHAGIVVPGEIGRPVGSRAWVVEPGHHPGLKLTAHGEVGELVVEGPLVARGYMNNPIQSETKFLKHSAQRKYRTGDLVRDLEDGRLVYVGRVDNQVKIRGQRLELEEVEEHVRRSTTSPDIRIKNVLVDAAIPLGATSRQLVAWLSLETSCPFGSLDCGDENGGVTVRATSTTKDNFSKFVALVEERMKSTVPSYMIPSLWIPIDEMPYTMSRKRDRQRLRRAIESLSTMALATFIRKDDGRPDGPKIRCSMTIEEKLLRRLWSDILGLDLRSILPKDNFFHLGGNSLLAMRLVSMARKEGKSIVTGDVFAHPVLQELAPKLVSATSSVGLAPFALLEPSHELLIRKESAQQCSVNLDDIEDIFPLYSMQEHYVLGYPELSRNSAGPWDWQQQIVFLLPESFNISLFKDTVNEAIKRHTQLRTRVVRTSCSGIFQVVLRNEVAPAWRDANSLDDYVRWDRDFIMSFGDELLRLAIVKSAEQSYFVLTMQHLIYDAYSRDMLFKEIEATYLHQSPPQTEPPKMGEFIRYINGGDRRLATEFWTSYLEGSSTKALLSAPISSRVSELRTHKVTLGKPQLPRLNYTLATIIEASVALAIAQILECRDVIFYSDRAGRNLPVAGIQDLMAPATLYLPLRVSVDRQQAVHNLLCVHQASNTAMMPYEYLGWTELRKMDHLKSILQHSINMNINPYTALGTLGASMGLKVVDEHERWGDPFTIDVSIREDEVVFRIYFDASFVAEDVVRKLTGNIREAFQLVATAYMDEQRSVGDVLATLDAADSRKTLS